MLTLQVFLAVLVFAAPGSDALETQLRQEYVGSQRMLRHFCAADKLNFDSSGNPLNQERATSWTIAGAAVIEQIKLDTQKLELQGHRSLITFDNEHRQLRYVKSNQKVLIEIVTNNGPNQESQIRTALAKVFAEQNEFPSLVPEYWRDYLERFSGTKTGSCEKETPPESTVNSASQRRTAPDEGSGGNLIQRAEPLYVAAARKAGIQGDVQLSGLIAKTGTVTNICIVKALGAGLDDSVIDAVRQWRYSPYLQNGEPIEVDTTIDIKFRK